MTNNLRQVREAKGLSRRQLAEKSGLSIVTIYRAEEGNNIRHECAHAMATALNVKPSDVFDVVKLTDAGRAPFTGTKCNQVLSGSKYNVICEVHNIEHPADADCYYCD